MIVPDPSNFIVARKLSEPVSICSNSWVAQGGGSVAAEAVQAGGQVPHRQFDRGKTTVRPVYYGAVQRARLPVMPVVLDAFACAVFILGRRAFRLWPLIR
jgi:hypothetical protein